VNKQAEEFVRFKSLAIVGVSRSGRKFGNIAQKELKTRGYQTFIVHPTATEIDGEPCFASLSSLRGKVDGVVISVPPDKAVGVIRESSEAGIRRVWLQRGAESSEAIKAANDLGIDVVAGKCVLMYAPPVRSLHSFHRFFMKLFGRL